eukprot:5424140-Pyramimonas_sp.AAC.1
MPQPTLRSRGSLVSSPPLASPKRQTGAKAEPRPKQLSSNAPMPSLHHPLAGAGPRPRTARGL